MIETLDRARELWAANQPRAAMATVSALLRADPGHLGAKALLVDLIEYFPEEVDSDTVPCFRELLSDAAVDPVPLNRAGWAWQRREDESFAHAGTDAELGRLAARLEGDEIALTLLRESPVGDRVAEQSLTRLRRWLLLGELWGGYPLLVSALGVQAALNGGAWPFDDSERDLVSRVEGTPVGRCYVRRASFDPAESVAWADGITRAVAGQYERWPYPAWRRVTRPVPRRLHEVIQNLGMKAAAIPLQADILVAGCASGRVAATVALEYPDARVTAIDLSESSLDYARRQCAVVGANAIRFHRMDLHAAEALSKRFDAIFCVGVLHHLPDPEAGWAALGAALKPGGVMHIGVYSRIARSVLKDARALVRDLLEQPLSDDLLRRIRHRVISDSSGRVHPWVRDNVDLSTLVGTCDLLAHAHEDLFDVDRVERALDELGLRLLAFDLPTPMADARYNAMFPKDRLRRDFASWKLYEFLNPRTFTGCYHFWCMKPGNGNPDR